MYDKEFPPLPTINNAFPTYINTNSHISSVLSIMIEKRKKKVFNKVDELKKKQKKMIHQTLQAYIHIINQHSIHI